jgi:IclR family KDG regulon transcriptional repressor
MKNDYQVPMVIKTLKILQTLAKTGSQMSLTEVVRDSRVAKASAFRILQTLQSAGYLEKDDASGHYRIGIKVLEISHAVEKNVELRSLGASFLIALQQQFNESANLAVLDRGDVLYLATVESTSSLRMARGDLIREPIHCTALGKVMAAYSNWDTIEAILRSKGMQRRTEHTFVSRTGYKKELEKVRHAGVAYEIEEVELGGWCVAAPVVNFSNEVVAALSVAAPISRIAGREKEIAKAVRASAQEFSVRLGFRPESAT